ncbi:MAG: NADH-quinone oxidoreductase subunit A [Candidatus Margulisiibacteriota bacterium]
MSAYLPILMMFAVVLGFVATTMVATHWLGPRRHSRVKDAPFECGIESVENARRPFSVKYFLIAILFVLFDVEIVFFYPWAVNFKSLGWTGFLEMGLFMGVFLIGFAFLLHHDVFDFLKDD